MSEKQIDNVGIISLFYNSTNYGGILQSYALVKVLSREFDVNARQICYKYIGEKSTIKKIFNLPKLYRFIKRKINELLTKNNREKVADAEISRFKPFNSFVDDNIFKTDKIYNKNTIKDVLSEFSLFITGSDQVWNVNYYDEIYRLDFVPASKYKFSYAAGVSSAELTAEEKKIFKNTLSTYDADSDLSICSFYMSEEQLLNKININEDVLTFSKVDALKNILLGKYFAGHVCNKLFKKALLQNVLFDKSICLCEDLLFSVEYINRCNKIVYSNLPLYVYVERITSVCHSKMSNSKLSALIAQKRIKEIIPNELDVYYRYNKIMLLLLYMTMDGVDKYIAIVKNELDVAYTKQIYKMCSLKTKIRIFLAKRHLKFYLFLNRVKYRH